MSLKKYTTWNLIGAGAPLLVGVITIPFLISKLGIESFGILTLIWALIGYFSLFDFGLGRALTQQIASMRAVELTDQIPRLVKAGLVFIAATGLVGGGLLAVLSPMLSQSWLNIGEGLKESALFSFVIASIGIPLTTVTTGLRGILEAYEDFKTVNILRVSLGVLNFALPALSVIAFGPILEYAVLSLVVARAVVILPHFLLVNKKLSAQWLRETFEYSDVKILWQFGAWMTVSNVVSPLMVTADRFVISAVLGAAVVAYYSVPFDTLMRMLMIPGALTVALFPRITALIANDLSAAKKLYSKATSIVAMVFTPILLITSLSAHLWLSLWLGTDFADRAWVATAILSMGICFNGMAQIPHAVIQAKGNARLTALIHLAELILYIPLLFIAIKSFGIIGAAGVWGLRAIADFLILRTFAKKIFLCDERKSSTERLKAQQAFKHDRY